jgi:hypothetical protein
MWIDESDTTTRHDIGVEHILEECRLAHTGLPDDIGMTSSVDGLYSELLCRSTIVRQSDRCIGLSDMREIVGICTSPASSVTESILRYLE